MSRESVKKKKKRKRRILLRLLLFILIIILAFGGYVIYSAFKAANSSYEEIDRGNKSELREEEVTVSKDPFSVLLMGIEDYTSGGKGGRSDTLMVATFNPNEESMKLVSIPRDSLVKIPGKQNKDKINHSYSTGGKELTIKTVENYLDIPIDYYATINFEGFVNTIDILGGVTVDVPFDFWDYKQGDWNTKYYFTEGKMKLDGDEALTYARMRYRDPMGDIGRNERQKQIVMAVIDELVKPTSVMKIDKISKEIGNNIQTNLRVRDLLAILKQYPNFGSDNIETLTLEGTSDTINGISYIIPDENSVNEIHNELMTHLELQSQNQYGLNENSTN
ncbi:LCP family protein [Bacillus sp. JJ1562]|uniref:LCP family protein n=1 Tax=Bacillus sp. JJ1562 TaxID=3122960 RepID=UPI0030033B9E